MKISPAKIVSESSHIVPGSSSCYIPISRAALLTPVKGKLKVKEYFFDVPKDYTKPDAGTIRIFGRSICKHEVPIVPDASPEKSQLPLMCYLQGVSKTKRSKSAPSRNGRAA